MNMKVCEYCYQEMKSRGEKLILLEHGYADEDDCCEFCDEIIHGGEDFYEVKEG